MCNWLFANYPIVLIAILLIYVTWKLFILFNRFVKVETTLNEHLKDYSEIKHLVHKIDKQLAQLLIYLQSKDTHLKGLIQSNSPLELTELAKKVLKEYGAENYLHKNRIHLLDQIKQMNPQTSLDVQNMSFAVLSEQDDLEAFNEIKSNLCQTPVIRNPHNDEVQIDLSTISYIMSIVLRNDYLDIHPHIEPCD